MLAVDAAGAGRTVPCSDCGQGATVPELTGRFLCPQCKAELAAPADLAGHECTCPTCQRMVILRPYDKRIRLPVLDERSAYVQTQRKHMARRLEAMAKANTRRDKKLLPYTRILALVLFVRALYAVFSGKSVVESIIWVASFLILGPVFLIARWLGLSRHDLR
jgi:hypothetical protein